MKIVNFDCDVCALTDTGLVRSHNEDSNRVEQTRNGSLFVVCDGMGGHVGGATASRIGVDSICEYVKNNDCALPNQFLENALQYANKKIYEQACADTRLKGMGTTGCVALVREDTVWYAHVGDSRIYYYNAQRQTLYRLTKDHSLVQSMVDRGEITEFQAEHHPEKNKILRSLGIKNTVEPESCEKPLKPADGDALLICSDGLSGMMEEKAILNVIASNKDVNESGRELINLAKAGGGTDNITVQIVRFSNTGREEADFLAKNVGVTSSDKPFPKKQNMRVWPWIVIVLSAIVIGAAAAFLLNGKTKQMESIPRASVQIDTTPAWQKYVQEKCPNVTPVQFKKGERSYDLYIMQELPNHNAIGILIDKQNLFFIDGEFEPLPRDGKTIYEPRGTPRRFDNNGKEVK